MLNLAVLGRTEHKLGYESIKTQVLWDLKLTKASIIWGFVSIYDSEDQSCTAHSMFELHEQTPYEIVAEETHNISE